MPTPPVIEKIWAYVATEADGSEGIVAIYTPGIGFAPAIGADEARIRSYSEYMAGLAETGVPIKLVRFEARIDLETVASKADNQNN